MSNPLINIKAGVLKDCIRVAESTANDEGVIRPKEDRWILKTVDPSNALLAGFRVPEEAMNTYSGGDQQEFSVKYSDLKNFMSDSSAPFEIEYSGSHLYYRHANNEAQMGIVPVENVAGNAVKTPSLDQAVTMEGDIEFLTDFLNKADNFLGTDTVLLAAREEGLYLYAEEDGPNLHNLTEWGKFDSYSIDLDKVASTPDSQPSPEEINGVDSVFSLDFMSELYFPADTVRIEIDQHNPVKFVFQMDEGIDVSYTLTPRVPSGSTVMTLPDRVRNKEQQTLTQD